MVQVMFKKRSRTRSGHVLPYQMRIRSNMSVRRVLNALRFFGENDKMSITQLFLNAALSVLVIRKNENYSHHFLAMVVCSMPIVKPRPRWLSADERKYTGN